VFLGSRNEIERVTRYHQEAAVTLPAGRAGASA
jgi:hypothetical protein